jgi:hypothetical protein
VGGSRRLSPGDCQRVAGALAKLCQGTVADVVVTGGVAASAQLKTTMAGDWRPLNDLDIVVESFDAIPPSWADGFLCRHIHPRAPAGKLLLQLVDAEAALRIDVFHAVGSTLARTGMHSIGGVGTARMVSLEDLAARAATMILGLGRGKTVARKHVDDFDCLSATIDRARVEVAWSDHRRLDDPETFGAASARIASLVRTHQQLLVVPEYSQDVDAKCSACKTREPFVAAPATQVYAILGYC